MWPRLGQPNGTASALRCEGFLWLVHTKDWGDLFQIAAPDALSNAAKQEMPHGTRSEFVVRRQCHGDCYGALAV